VNTRTRRVLGCAPTERIAADTAAMLPLPPVAPATGWRACTWLARDHYVRIDANESYGGLQVHTHTKPDDHRIQVVWVPGTRLRR
jgi:hypothetical protein